MGSVRELSDRYGQPDMEELFFKLIDQHEKWTWLPPPVL